MNVAAYSSAPKSSATIPPRSSLASRSVSASWARANGDTAAAAGTEEEAWPSSEVLLRNRPFGG